MDLKEPYAARSIRLLELWQHRGWRIKLYGLSYSGAAPDPRLVHAARRIAAARLPVPAVTAGRYGVGFMGVHQGRGSNLVFVDWWADENELHHHAYTSPSRAPGAFEYVTPAGLAACVWDLAVIAFERQAWIDAVLASPVPDLDRYLEARLEGRL